MSIHMYDDEGQPEVGGTQATWITASAFDTAAYMDHGPFDVVISNPPFGRNVRIDGFEGRYTGREVEFQVIETAARLAPGGLGVFIVPQESSPFVYSGREPEKKDSPWNRSRGGGRPATLTESLDTGYRVRPSRKYEQFHEETGLTLEANCGIDTSIHGKDWHGTAPKVEIVLCDFPRSTP